LEKFCNQGSISYCPIPFFITDCGLGVWIDTATVTEFEFGENIRIVMNKDSQGRLPKLSLFTGQPAEMLSEYVRQTGQPAMVPKWCFTPWMSANRWNTQEEVLKQVALAKQYRFPHGVLVIEAWSDEATFYRFNEHDEWKDPKVLVNLLKEKGIRLILWQIPVLKKLKHGEKCKLHDEDWEYAVMHNLCIKNLDGTPYTIPEGHWFAGSLLPDFTYPDTVKWWFEKRQYLLDMGISGFKTDGGEFVLSDDVTAVNRSTGLELRNQFVTDYLKEYTKFIGKDRVLFSRAGYIGQQKYPIQWAGDQVSTWEELKHVLIAGLSIGLSGVPFWGFDIGGFAGAMPSVQLYERATQLSVFAPIMQWHSEPAGGQFAELYPTTDGINDRSPWNISRLYQDDALLDRLRYQYNLRMNLLPYLYNEAIKSVETGLPMMKHLVLEYPEDEKVRNMGDSFMLGNLLIAPILEEGQIGRRVYLPKGMWTGLWPMEAEDIDSEFINSVEKLRLQGGRSYLINSGQDKIPVFIRDGGCLALNLDASLTLGSAVGNDASKYECLSFYPAGTEGEYHFRDEEGNELLLGWMNGKCEVKQLAGKVKYLLNKI
jgi:alpha-D-xyloside xylohydrolase